MAEFIENLPKLQFHLIAAEACIKVNELCKCGSGLYRRVACDECYHYEATCEKCFIRDHCHHPFHWAKVWQSDGFFLKVDISFLENNSYTIQLPCSKGSFVCKEPTNCNIVTLVDTNGIHGTRISYCGCNGDPDRVQQLMDARLFPASVKFPRTLMTFQVLKHYTKHNLASKKSSYDFIRALRALSDGFFTQEVLVSVYLLTMETQLTPMTGSSSSVPAGYSYLAQIATR